MTEKQPYTFKRLHAGLYKDLVYISKSAFGYDPGIEYYCEKNETAKFGEPFLGYIAYSKSGEPAAFYGVYAHPVETNGKIVCAAQSGDTMTHKDHFGKGLFTQLAKLTYDLAKEKGVQFVYGFPNEKSYPGLAGKLQWVFPSKLKEYKLKVLTFPLAKFVKKIPFLKGLYSAYVSFVFSFYKELKPAFKNSVLEYNVSGIARTPDFIKYKSFSGCKFISLNGFCAWLKVDGTLQLGDMERAASSDFNAIIKKIKRIAFILGCDNIVFQSTPGSFWDKIFAQHFVAKDSLAFGYLDLGYNFPVETLQFITADLDTF